LVPVRSRSDPDGDYLAKVSKLHQAVPLNMFGSAKRQSTLHPPPLFLMMWYAGTDVPGAALMHLRRRVGTTIQYTQMSERGSAFDVSFLIFPSSDMWQPQGHLLVKPDQPEIPLKRELTRRITK
jgi:hypothetical protein